MGGGKGKRAELYEGGITWYFIFAVIVAALGGSLFGYDLGVSGMVFFSVPWLNFEDSFCLGCFVFMLNFDGF